MTTRGNNYGTTRSGRGYNTDGGYGRGGGSFSSPHWLQRGRGNNNPNRPTTPRNTNPGIADEHANGNIAIGRSTSIPPERNNVTTPTVNQWVRPPNLTEAIATDRLNTVCTIPPPRNIQTNDTPPSYYSSDSNSRTHPVVLRPRVVVMQEPFKPILVQTSRTMMLIRSHEKPR